MGNYTAGARTFCPFYIKESDKGITCEGVVPGTTQLMRFDTMQDKRKHQKAHCERKDYAALCPLATLLTERSECDVANSITIVANSNIAARMVVIGGNIKQMRDVLGLSQDQLAQLACLSRSHLSNIECGQRAPSLDTLMMIAKALHTDVGALIPKREG